MTTSGNSTSRLPGDKVHQISAELFEIIQDMKVMVVDDSRTLRKLLIRELNAIGITNIMEAVDGLEAISLLQLNSFDLMLLDMEMPELDGLGVLRKIKSDQALSYLPVIVVSGAEELDKTVECIQIGAEDYLPKPFNSFACACLLLIRKEEVERHRRTANEGIKN